MSEPDSPARRCAVIAILGAPNAGKSTLVNALVGAKIAAVTHKVQTTRASLRGIAMRGEAQLVFIDTPGVFAPRRRLDRAMVGAAWAALEGADFIIHLIDAAAQAAVMNGDAQAKPKGADARAVDDSNVIAARLKEMNKPAILVLNKVDAIERSALLTMTGPLVEQGLYTDVFMIAARTGDGVEDLALALAERAPEGPWLFPEDEVADAPARLIAAELTRERAMLRLHDELPYEAFVETSGWEERADGSVRIEQTLYVARESQRRIAIGAKGASIKAIGEAARKEIEAALGRRAHLFLTVKVREDWTEARALYAQLGLDWNA
jgi:GTPase